jgi:Putative Ig domain
MAKIFWRHGFLAVASSLALSACDFGDSGSKNADGDNPNPSTQGGPNTAPTISGVPATSVAAGTTYVFQPNAADVDGDTLTFSVTGRPAWASFSPQTGALSGTPAAGSAGTSSMVTISVSDGEASASLATFTISVTGTSTPPTNPPSTPPTTNVAPVISGTPAATVQANAAYSFTPSASDANGDSLGFSITGKPAWATFSTATGALSGTPTTAQVGSYSNIVITVSDGQVSRSLPAFAINVTSSAGTGTASLSWSAPTQNTDGTTLTNLGGYKIYHGTSASALNDVRTVAANSASYQFTALASGTHYFAISAYNTDGVESSLSAVGSKTIQ